MSMSWIKLKKKKTKMSLPTIYSFIKAYLKFVKKLRVRWGEKNYGKLHRKSNGREVLREKY